MDDAARITRSGTEKRQRIARPAMRCTKDELAQLEGAAELAGMTVSAYMRHQCLGTAGPRAARRPPIERAALSSVLAQLGRIGGNLNQIARVLNTAGRETGDLEMTLSEVRSLRVPILKMLGYDAS